MPNCPCLQDGALLEVWMKKRNALFFAFAAVLVATLSACLQVAPKARSTPEAAIEGFLDRTYGKPDKKYNARIVRASSTCIGTPENEIDCNPFREGSDEFKSDYYMKIHRIDRVGDQDSSGKEKYYVLVTGAGEPACHACTGMFGAFVFEWQNGELNVVASAPHVIHGSSGEPAASWELIKLNSAGYYGWFARHSGDSWQEHHFRWAEIHAPHNDRVVPLFELTTAYHYEGIGYEDGVEGKAAVGETALEMDIQIDTADENAAVYPLKAVMSGTLKGKKIRPRTFIIPFDENEWKYVPSAEFEEAAKLMK